MNRPYRHRDLGLPASRTVRKNPLLFEPPSLWHVVIAARADSRLALTFTRRGSPLLLSPELGTFGSDASVQDGASSRAVLLSSLEIGDLKTGFHSLSETSGLPLAAGPLLWSKCHMEQGRKPGFALGRKASHTPQCGVGTCAVAAASVTWLQALEMCLLRLMHCSFNCISF